MANVGARKDMPLGDFGAFEGEMVLAGTLNFQGQRPAPRVMSEGDTVHLLVQAEVKAVGFSRNADGNLTRRHTLKIVEAAEAPDSIEGAVITVIRAAADEREGRVPLAFDEDGNANPDGASDEELLALEEAAAAEEAAEDAGAGER